MLDRPRFYVYRCVRHDTNEVFYVGKGAFRKARKWTAPERALAPKSNPIWRRIAAKCGEFSTEIVMQFHTDQEAQQKEKELIALYGRIDMETGTLANFTDGGDGHAGRIYSAETRALLSERAKAPRGEKWVASIRRARKNGGNGGVVKLGDKLPQWWRDRMAPSKIGAGNPMFGRAGARHPTAKKIIDSATGEIFDSVSAAAEARGFKMKSLHNKLTGHRSNTTTLRFL